ncbi:MAG TPA: adenylate/guanylate cyclase domain-containing protein [Candidatus Cloacimonadota bacterium]|nr:adenylate/guanylate cyclase domain-containing protein [Candidatus Cloacimonadota bacterium]
MAQRPVFHWVAKHYKQYWVLALLALLLALVIYRVSSLSFLREIESKTIDARFRACPRVADADTNIVICAIDQSTLNFCRDELRQNWPFPRQFYAVISEYLAREQAAAVIYDMSFDTPDIYRGDIDSRESDADFAKALRKGGSNILSAIFTTYPTLLDTSFVKHADPGKFRQQAQPWKGVQAPVPEYADACTAIGGISLLNEKDANVRKAPLFYPLYGRNYPNVSLAAVRQGKWAEYSTAEITRIMQGIPLDKDGQLYLNWYGKGGVDGVFRYIPFSNLLSDAVSAREATTATGSRYKGKYVIICATAPGLLDLKASSYSWGIAGGEVWATFLSNLIGEEYLRFVPWYGDLLLMFLTAFLVMAIVSRMRSGISPIMVILFMLLLSAGIFWTFGAYRLSFNFTGMMGSLIVSWLTVLSLSYIMEGRTKRELRMIFSRYLHPDLVDRITDDPSIVQMGGEDFSATVMFSDIYDFTTVAEPESPANLVKHLNDYFRTFTNSILDHNGLLDKYTGDGLMAVFGVPIVRSDHALWACRAALAHRDYCKPFRDKDPKDLTLTEYFHLKTRLGINSGMLVAGNIGSERRMDYTSIGDTVNLASRLESVNKVFGTNIVISESTWKQVQDYMLCRELDYILVKGKHTPTRIFELIGEKSFINENEYSWLGLYHDALELYRQGNFVEALELFNELQNQGIKDMPTLTLIRRCRALIITPPKTWDGIYALQETEHTGD